MTHDPGTLFVLRSGGFVSKTIRLLTRSRYNHAGVCVDRGLTVEAEAAGAVQKRERPVDTGIVYGDELLHRIRLREWGNGHDHDGRIDRGDRIAIEAKKLLGTKYNFLDLVALAWAMRKDPTGVPDKPNWWQRRIMRDDRLICSQLADLACQRAGIHLFIDGRLPGQVTPEDLHEVMTNPSWPIAIEP